MRAFRVAAYCLLPSIALEAADATAPQSVVVAIATTSAVQTFDEATQGIRRGLGPEPRVSMIELATRRETLATLLVGRDSRLVITVGNNALDAVAQIGATPIIAAMIMRTDLSVTRQHTAVGAAVLDLMFTDVLAGLSKIFPGKSRAGMIRSLGAGSTPAATLTAQAKAAGMSQRIVDCPLPEKPIESLLSLREQVDFVWCPPDGDLFNGTAVKPLALASIASQLPVVGFSASFVRAGAAAGIYPDYVEVGVRAGEMARKYLAGSAVPAQQTPRKIRVASNPRIARLLGLRLQRRDLESGMVVIE